MSDPITTVAYRADLWRAACGTADARRDYLIAKVVDAHAAGASEYQLAEAAGVSRGTIRKWLGK